ncbi:HAD family hydrolase [Levilactobacillus acidifarinae]|uniref:HAD superfamily hydrolase n=1 Tax=Levilactobacillus acidifarinae DSM 19394 = JCM 15949 TaxID=1423715 RepID=A0A0R1LSS4_9LACO|nr:HAD family hydrolase [Levilactobacillus acidifarinae]KRK95849.1 HAD superfamily hydrolase [Levilactobacillus acidifarinae DSM 19394]GEO69147.1 phosphohydrolase [Levilactobacillus acidifarinae]
MSEKFLTFDCYGTLLNEEATYAAIETAATKIGVAPKLARQRFIAYQDDRNNMHPYLDYAVLTRNNLIHLDYQFGLDHQFERYYVDVLIAHRSLTPFPEVIATLKTLQQRGYHLIMMSNSSWDIIDANAAALTVPFDVWTAEDVHAYKPDLHFFRTIAKEYGLTATNHWHIAQGYASDIVPADQLGWPSIWVNRDQATPTTAARPTHMVPMLDQALPFLP